MKFINLTFLIIILAAILWKVLPRDKLPPIFLPRGAQHNTVGELPLVEVMDDGDFYVIDGDEQKYKNNWIEECARSLTAQCDERLYSSKNTMIWKKRKSRDKKKCIEDVKMLCASGIPDCGELKKRGLMWTCGAVAFR